jgi:predicted AlkP superfamily phosphohydrolase/phosphomutase
MVKDVNGLQVMDWLVHDRQGKPRSWPPQAMQDILSRYGDDPFGGETDSAGKTADDYVEMCKLMLKRVDTKTEMSCAYLEDSPWDMFMTVYGESHDIGHQCWHLHDKQHPHYDPQLAVKTGDPIKEVYARVDHGIGRMIEKTGPDTMVIVMGGLGMESGYTANFLLDQILRRIEAGPESSGLTYVDSIKKVYRKVAPPALRNRLARFGQRREQDMLIADRRRRKSFAIPHNEHAGAVRVNLIGREPDGKVDPAQLNNYLDELTADLKAIVNLETGDPLIKEVVRISDICEGEQLNRLPDLLLLWHRPVPIRRIGSAKIGEIDAVYPGDRTGDHSQKALLVANGPTISGGGSQFDSSVLDICPTIHSLLDVPADNMDGKVITEIASS